MIPQTKLLCEMCHDAVQCIVSGLYDDAAEVLTKALSDIQQEIVAASSTEESPNGSSSPLLVPQYYQVDMDDEPSSSQIHVFDATRNMEQHKIFAAPLIVPVSNDTRYQPCSNEQYQFIITYNLALSYHLAAMTQRNLQKLEVALGLWDLIYRFHWNEDLGLVTFHTCAILNNHGHGLQQVGAEKPARDCFESLLCALCLCVEKKTHMSPVSELDSCCWNECFFHSVSTLVLKDPMTARAA
ncbi:hypothetical protein IV203_038379 [Nitzschia inconspicua]|uniref:Uncharacterized protein n=1 Tax=Nitzschia inconspicua TaxID=303405 RepID=A0A9K3LRB6_9STRA|nr:hypothetical protein IV203_038379 [Nitzschia inconspicua]